MSLSWRIERLGTALSRHVVLFLEALLYLKNGYRYHAKPVCSSIYYVLCSDICVLRTRGLIVRNMARLGTFQFPSESQPCRRSRYMCMSFVFVIHQSIETHSKIG